MTTHSASHTVPTSFVYKGTDDITQVSLVGSWDEWSNKIPMQRQPNANMWLVHLNLAPGYVTFKFVTDGRWLTTSTYDLVDDGFGGENNSRLISAPNSKPILNAAHEDSESKPNDVSDEKEEDQEQSNCLIG